MVPVRDCGGLTLLTNCKVLSFLAICLVASLAHSSPVIDWGKDKGKVIEDYLNIHDKFFQQVCRGDYQIYDELLKSYKGAGYFVPRFSQYTKLDREAIKNNLDLLKEKIAWIEKEKKGLEGRVGFEEERKKVAELDVLLRLLIDFKKRFYATDATEEILERIKIDSKKILEELDQRTQSLLDRISFLKPFAYPVDHLAMRVAYETYKKIEDEKGQKKKNDIYFKRRIYEDGAQNLDRSSSDRFFRALVNTLHKQFKEQGEIISENFRYDYNSFLTSLGNRLKLSPRVHRERLGEWLKRTQETLNFYLNLLKKDAQKETKEILEESSKARYEIKHFDFQKKSEVYSFWIQETELNRAIYAIETILYNEAGDIDGREALERRDIAQVVINRTRIPFYRTVDEGEELYPYLKGIGYDKLTQTKWLNTMFKVGEFSFTYFFISASKNIYCPDTSIRGNFLRRENVRIALDLLKKPNDDFKAIRYFSRASMLGRIDMTKVWTDFEAVPQRLGGESLQNSILKKIYRRGDYLFIDKFYDQKGRDYNVIQIAGRSSLRGKLFVYHPKEGIFYDYRNPHFFKYFIKK